MSNENVVGILYIGSLGIESHSGLDYNSYFLGLPIKTWEFLSYVNICPNYYYPLGLFSSIIVLQNYYCHRVII